VGAGRIHTGLDLILFPPNYSSIAANIVLTAPVLMEVGTESAFISLTQYREI